MKVVHLFSNWKWTGPAEPAVGLAGALGRRGHEVLFLSGRPIADFPDRIANEAEARGCRARPGLTLGKHVRFFANRRDERDLAGILAEFAPDIVHCHLPNDHLIAANALRRGGRRIPLVRSLYDGEAPAKSLRARKTIGRSTDFLLAASERVRAETAARFGLSEARTARLEGAVDLGRFDPGRALPDLRATYDIEEGDFVLGIVARIQPRRRFDVFFDALDRVAIDVPRLRVLVVGRGTHMQSIAVDRADRTILGDRIRFTGYRTGDEYVATLAALSAKVFLWPGSDGSCRAVREAMAMGVPVIAARVGMLDEIVTDGADGILIPHDPEVLAHAVRRLALGLGERDEMAEAARRTAIERFDLERQAKQVETVYLGLT